MKRRACLAAAVVFAFSSVGVWAQAASESFVGVVKSISATSITVERGSITGVFGVDSSTYVGAKGASTKTRAAKEAGKPGITVADVVHVGDQVKVTYQQKGNAMAASKIEVRASLATGKQ